MKKIIFLLVFCCSSAMPLVMAQNEELPSTQQVQCIAFYNLENVFDTLHAEGTDDAEYLPDSAKAWNTEKYHNKIHNMAYAISLFGTDYDARGAVCVGLSEVENMNCLNDIVEELKKYNRNYSPILLEGPDERGLDVGFLYNPDFFKPTNVQGYELFAHYADGTEVKGRLQLLVSGYLLEGHPEKIHIIVNHWPSRYRGELASRVARDTAAMLTKRICDSIYIKENNAKIIIMGDMNDDPFNHSCANVLGARKMREEVEKNGFFNTMWLHLDKGLGSLCYQGTWNLFDQIIISEPLMNAQLEDGKWTYWKSQIFNKPFLTVQEGDEKGVPLRTHKSGVYQNGYSDHFPTMIYLVRKNQ